MRTHVCRSILHRIILFSVADRIYKKLNRYQNYNQTYIRKKSLQYKHSPLTTTITIIAILHIFGLALFRAGISE